MRVVDSLVTNLVRFFVVSPCNVCFDGGMVLRVFADCVSIYF